MARLDNFDPDQVPEGDRDFAPMPAGRYVAQIIESDLVPTKSGTGQMLKLTFEIIEGPCARRRVWANLNIINQSGQAQEIGQRELKHICAAVGHVGVLNDSDVLHFKPMRVRLGIEVDAQYGDKNVCKGYEPMSGPAPKSAPAAERPAATERPAQPAQVASGGAKTRPWA